MQVKKKINSRKPHQIKSVVSKFKISPRQDDHQSNNLTPPSTPSLRPLPSLSSPLTGPRNLTH